MRHRKSGRQLNRNSSHRKAMYRNMACSLFEHKVIRTTLPKAKELRRVVEPLITHAKKNDSVAGRRHAFDRLRSDAAVATLFEDVAPRCKDRNGGYVRILKGGFRTGDKAPMAFVELVDREGAINNTETTKSDVKVAPEQPQEQSQEQAQEQPQEQPVVSDAVADAGVENPVEAAAETGQDAAFDADAAKSALGKAIKQDDLTMVEGIGPKIAEILSTAGIATWAELAKADSDNLRDILAGAGDRYKMHDPGTWAKQAELAAAGKWTELAEWQDKLDGGREAD